jgi:hypothetical protein
MAFCWASSGVQAASATEAPAQNITPIKNIFKSFIIHLPKTWSGQTVPVKKHPLHTWQTK